MSAISQSWTSPAARATKSHLDIAIGATGVGVRTLLVYALAEGTWYVSTRTAEALVKTRTAARIR